MLNRVFETVSRRFTKDQRGVAAIEGAIILPLIITVFMGLVDLSSANRLSRDLDRAAASVAAVVVSETRFDLVRQAIVLNGLSTMISPEAGAGRPANSSDGINGSVIGLSSLTAAPAAALGRADPKMKVLVAGITNDNGAYRTDWTWAPYGEIEAVAPTSLFDNALPNGAFGVVVYVQKTHNSFFGSGAFGNYTLGASYAARPTKTTRILK